jgi:hypothetical protein
MLGVLSEEGSRRHAADLLIKRPTAGESLADAVSNHARDLPGGATRRGNSRGHLRPGTD